MIRPHHLGDQSTFLGQTCALCKQEFGAGDDIVICPEDGSRHHAHCWQANNNHCTAYGCRGQGIIGAPTAVPTFRSAAEPSPEEPSPEEPAARPPSRPRVVPMMPPPRSRPGAARPIPNAPGSKVRTLPAGSFGCVRGCFFFLLVLVFILVALACVGAWFFTVRTTPAPTGAALPLLTGVASLAALRCRPF